jgi:hypothetical protein
VRTKLLPLLLSALAVVCCASLAAAQTVDTSPPVRVDFAGMRVRPAPPSAAAAVAVAPPMRMDFVARYARPSAPSASALPPSRPPVRIDFSGIRSRTEGGSR